MSEDNSQCRLNTHIMSQHNSQYRHIIMALYVRAVLQSLGNRALDYLNSRPPEQKQQIKKFGNRQEASWPTFAGSTSCRSSSPCAHNGCHDGALEPVDRQHNFSGIFPPTSIRAAGHCRRSFSEPAPSVFLSCDPC